MTNTKCSKVLVIGAGLAGSEAAWFLASRNIKVVLVEAKTKKLNPAQKIKTFAELVCTNSLKSSDPDSAHGLLKGEMTALGSIVIEQGKLTSVPAGNALAVDREKFSLAITEKLKSNQNIQIIEEEVDDPFEFAKKFECEEIIIATGPLTTTPLEQWIQKSLSEDDFYFYDAIAPVVDADSLDTSKMYFKDRYKDVDDEVEADYLNVALNEEQYNKFVTELINAEKVKAQNFEEYKFFESCLPIDTMAERGVDTPRYSCMKPVGLRTPDGEAPYAVVQLRRENLLGSAYNMVGFQTRLTYGEQLRVFRMLPGFENASFNHLGSVHRNSFLNSKELLNFDLSSKKYPNLYFAGQITGVEGYTESASMGLYVASQIFRKRNGKESYKWPFETAIGALVNYIMTVPKPCPSNINFGLLPSVVLEKHERRSKLKKKIKKEKAALRAREVFSEFKSEVVGEL